MKRFFQSEAGAAVLWVLSSLLLAALIAPWVYQGGKAFAAAAATHELGGILEWLGAACGRSKFGRYFSRSLSFSALVFLPLLFHRIRKLRTNQPSPECVLIKMPWKSVFPQLLTGCVIAGSMLWALTLVLESLGAYTPILHPPRTGKFLAGVLIPGVAASLAEETLFRGILLGIWLKSARPLSACVGTSLFFAFVHFLEPPPGSLVNPASPLAGFELLGKILFHFTEPRFFVTDFATLFLVGMILAWARIRTRSLWFSIGLHSGWVMAFKSCNLLYTDVAVHPLRPWGVGDNIRSGLLPLLMLGLTAVICHYVLRYFERQRPIA